jgi:hypothetical protein
MADDIWTALVKGTLAFGHTRAAAFVGDSFQDTGSFVEALSHDPLASKVVIAITHRNAVAGKESTQ